MKTFHKFFFGNSARMQQVKDDSVDLIVTSPPYPMIQMWDEPFSEQNPAIREALENNDGSLAFELMNKELDKTWNECYRVLKRGGIACINVGDATRSINNDFQLFPNASRVMSHCLKTGFSCLPGILWKKTGNAPNKFMGSGMLAPGAYVTLEHEYILIFRKGNRREFSSAREKENRKESAYFWEERNSWFSDVWKDVKGTPQKLHDSSARERSAAYPFELAYRLINMFSAKGDVVLDPYLGTGTTMLAAMGSGRNSTGFETNHGLERIIKRRAEGIVEESNARIEERIRMHGEFVKRREKEGKPLKYVNRNHGFRVMTKQETGMLINRLKSFNHVPENRFEIRYHGGKKESKQFLLRIRFEGRNKKSTPDAWTP